jgi:hypothetical protein
MEREAMQFAVELIHTSKAGCTMVTNRLQVISHEDIDTTAAPWVVPFVATAAQQAQDGYAKKPENPGMARMAVGNAIRLMCRSPKSREGDHFQASIGLASLLENFKPTIPDFANDQHTLAGRRLGRGLEHFREEGCKLLNPDGSTVPEDPYANEAYRLWRIKRGESPDDEGEPAQSSMAFGNPDPDFVPRSTGTSRKTGPDRPLHRIRSV